MSPPEPNHRPKRQGVLTALLLVIAGGSLSGEPVINEIHYNNDANHILNEFLELVNPGVDDLDLGGYRLTGGIEFTFPTPTTLGSGEFLVIAEQPATILASFGVTALGPYTGGLSGAGEEIRLVDAVGATVDRVNYGVNFPWPTRADGGGSSMELIDPSLDNDLGGSWRSSSTAGGEVAPPTPGAANTTAATLAPPAIRQVEHLPAQPTAAEPIVITAKVTDPQGVGTVELQYRPIAPGAYVPAFIAKTTSALTSNPSAPPTPNPAYQSGWISMPMLDDGAGNDAVAGDDIFTATLAAQPNRTLVRYRIRVADLPGTEVTVPYPDDPALNFALFVYNGIPNFVANTRSVTGRVPYIHRSHLLEALPAYHLLTTQADYNQCVAYNGADRISSGRPFDNNFLARSVFNWSGTFAYNGVVYDNMKYRLRQRNDRYGGSGKRSFRFRFNRGHYVQFHDLWGNPYPTRWRTLNSHKMSARGGPNFGLHESMNSILWNLTGTAAPYTHWFHLRVIKGTEEAPSGTNGQHLGDFYGLLLGVEDYDSRFLDSHNLEPGNIYKLKSYVPVTEGLSVQRYQAPGRVSNGRDYETIMTRLSPTAGPSASEGLLRRLVDWNSWNHYHAIVDAVRHYDVAPNLAEHLKNRTYYFVPSSRNSATGLLQVLPWDSDTSWGPNWNGGVDLVKNAMGVRATFNLEYRNVVREIRDLVWQEDQIHGLIDLLEQKITRFQLADRDRWTGSPASAGNQTDGPISTKTADMKRFAFVGGSWTGGDSGAMAAISRDNGLSGSQGRDAYLDALAADLAIPVTPVLTDLSASNHAANALLFESSPFSDPTGSFAVMEYRIAEYGTYANDSIPFPLEWDATWESGELDTFTAQIVPPASAVRGGRTYRARVRHKDSTGRWSHWSAPVEFTATDPDPGILQSSLVVSEIMYNPVGGGDLEYLEIKNIGPVPLDLTNVRFTKGIDFDFASGTTLDSGDYLLVVKNASAFEAHYGEGLPVAGEYQFEDENSLSNGGELLKLALGALPIHEFTYDNSAPWPTAPDGGGYSLVLAHTSDNGVADPLDPLGHGIASNWRMSTAIDGSPGTSTSQSFSGPDPDLDEDRDSLSAFMEHAIGTLDNDAASGAGLFHASIAGQSLQFTYQRNLRADDVDYRVEVSTDLDNWTPGVGLVSEIPNGDGTSTATFRSDALFNEHAKHFVRLRTVQVSPLP